MAVRNPRFRALRRAIWRYYFLTLGAVTVHLSVYLWASLFGIHLSVIATAYWTIEYIAALVTALFADRLDRAGITRTRLGRFLLGN